MLESDNYINYTEIFNESKNIMKNEIDLFFDNDIDVESLFKNDTNKLYIVNAIIFENIIRENLTLNYWTLIKDIKDNEVIFSNNLKLSFHVYSINNNIYRTIIRNVTYNVIVVLYDKYNYYENMLNLITSTVNNMIQFSLLFN